MINQKRVSVAQTEPEISVELLAKAIADTAEGMRRVLASRLKYETIVTLIHAESGVAKRDVKLVLNNLEALERIYLKPKPAKRA